MEQYYIDELFNQYGWVQGKVWFVYSNIINNQIMFAHIGGSTEDSLSVVFSIKGGEVLDKIYYNYKDLKEYLTELENGRN
jgi:hypothetical protein